MKFFMTGTVLVFLLHSVAAHALELSELRRAASDASREISDTESSLQIVTEAPRGPRILADKQDRPHQAIVDILEEEPKTIAKSK